MTTWVPAPGRESDRQLRRIALGVAALVALALAVAVQQFALGGYNPLSKLDRQAWEYRSLMDRLMETRGGEEAGALLSDAEKARLLDLGGRPWVVDRSNELWPGD